MNSNQYLEISIVKLKTNYKATCALFPLCKGVGASEEKALQNLSISIARHIGALAEQALSSILTSNHYTEVLLKEGSKEHKKAFPISKSLGVKGINLVYKPTSKNISSPLENPDKEEKDIEDFLDDLHSMMVMDTQFDVLPPEPIEGFGVPISLN